jgi:hypothetical protein
MRSEAAVFGDVLVPPMESAVLVVGTAPRTLSCMYIGTEARMEPSSPAPRALMFHQVPAYQCTLILNCVAQNAILQSLKCSISFSVTTDCEGKVKFR